MIPERPLQPNGPARDVVEMVDHARAVSVDEVAIGNGDVLIAGGGATNAVCLARRADGSYNWSDTRGPAIRTSACSALARR